MQVDLTQKEIEIAVRALIAWFSVDVNININEEDEEAMFELAKKLQVANGEKVDVGALYMVGSQFHDEPYKVKEVQRHFNIREE
jgi:hypothetical protein